jgi:hypothetical protein
VIIIVLCVIAIVLLAIFNPAIWDWIKELTGFEQSPEEPDLSVDSMKALGYWQVGKTEIRGSMGGARIYVVDNTDPKVESKNFIETDLYAKVDSDYYGDIYFDKHWNDPKVGEVKQGNFFIDMAAYSSLNSEYSTKVGIDKIALIDGSKWIAQGLLRMKNKENSYSVYVKTLSDLNEVYFKTKKDDSSLKLSIVPGEKGMRPIKNSDPLSLCTVRAQHCNLLAIILPTGEVYIKQSDPGLIKSLYAFDPRIVISNTQRGDTGYYLSNFIYRDEKLEIKTNT